MKTFSPKDHVVNFGGFELSGFADGTFINFAFDSEAFTDVAGADGEVARAASADERGTLTVTLLQTSQANDILSSQLAADRLSKATVLPVFVKDLRGTTVIAGAEAWLQKSADVEIGKEVGAREWKIRIAQAKVFVGGNL